MTVVTAKFVLVRLCPVSYELIIHIENPCQDFLFFRNVEWYAKALI